MEETGSERWEWSSSALLQIHRWRHRLDFRVLTGQSEIAHLQIAIGIEEQVAGLEISMDDIGGVNRLQGSQDLVGEILSMVVRELLRSNDSVQVRLHELLNEIDFVEAVI